MSATLDLAKIHHGFLDQVRDSQAVFRRVMDAVARPGTMADLAFAVDGPAGLDCAAAAVILTLLDFETTLWLDPSLVGTQAEAWIRFHTGCPIVEDPQAAAFALVLDAASAPALTAFNQGDARYPDRSTTVLVRAPALEGGEAVTLSGPGIRDTATIAPQGLPAGFWADVRASREKYQFGVDVMLFSGSSLIGLPRSTQIQTKEG